MVPYYDLGLEIQLIWSFGLAGATTVGFKQVSGFYIIGEPQGIHTFAQAQLPEQQCDGNLQQSTFSTTQTNDYVRSAGLLFCDWLKKL